MKRFVLWSLLVMFLVGCGIEKTEVPPVTDPERIKAEKERLKNMAKQTGEPRM